jgi:predicted transcriptional regulator
MAKRRENARSHGIEFTDADWERVKALAADWHTTPSALANRAIGDYVRQFNEDKRWDGLAAKGGGEHGEA